MTEPGGDLEGSIRDHHVGPARVDRRTKDLAKRLRPGEVAIIDHADLDRVAAETLLDAGVGAVVNAAASVTGRYPNTGPRLLVSAGVPLLDHVGAEVLDLVADGDEVVLDGDRLSRHGDLLARGTRLTPTLVDDVISVARSSMGDQLEAFASNTLDYIQREGHLLTDAPEIPDVAVDFRGRQVLVVVRGVDYKSDLAHLRRSGYLGEIRPLLIGVDGGADALVELGYRPDVIIGDFDSVTETTLRCGAALVVHAYPGGDAPGADRLDELGLDYARFELGGTSEDIAMLMAHERGAELIVAVGTHNSMVEFLDKGRAGMASTFLVRLRVGPILVDAKGVNRLYRQQVRKRDLLVLVLAALVTLVLIVAASEPVRIIIRGLGLPFR